MRSLRPSKDEIEISAVNAAEAGQGLIDGLEATLASLCSTSGRCTRLAHESEALLLVRLVDGASSVVFDVVTKLGGWVLQRRRSPRGADGAARASFRRAAIAGVTVCSLIVGLAGCANDAPHASVEAGPAAASEAIGWLDGLAVSSQWTTALVPAAEGDPVVIDTSDEGHVVAHVRVGDEVRSITDLDRPGLVFPVAWHVKEGVVAVFGRVCPTPALNDPSMLDAPIDGGCGINVHRFALRLVDLDSSTWSEVPIDVPLLGGQGLAVFGASGQSVLLRGGSRAKADIAALYGLDLTTGVVTDLGGSPPDVGPLWCRFDKGFLSVTLPDLTTSKAPQTKVVAVEAGRIETSSLPSEHPVVPIGCSNDSMLAIEPAGPQLLRVEITDSTPESKAVPLPDRLDNPASRRIDVGRRQPNQAPLLWEDKGDSFQLWEFQDAVWSKVGPVRAGTDPSMIAAVIDGHLVTFERSNSGAISLGV